MNYRRSKKFLAKGCVGKKNTPHIRKRIARAMHVLTAKDARTQKLIHHRKIVFPTGVDSITVIVDMEPIRE